MTAPVVGNKKSATADSANPEVLKPTGLSIDDVIALMVMSDIPNQDSDQFTFPGGFVEIAQGGASNTDVWTGAALRIVDGLESATFTVTLANNSGVQSDLYAAAVSGNHASSPLDVTGSANLQTVAANSHVIPEITTTVADTLAFYVIAGDGGDMNPWGQPTGWLEQGEGSFSSGAEVGSAWGTKTQASAAATGDATVSSSATDQSANFQFAIAPVAGGPAPVVLGQPLMGPFGGPLAGPIG